MTEGTYREVDFHSFQKRLTDRRLTEEWVQFMFMGPLMYAQWVNTVMQFYGVSAPKKPDAVVVPISEFPSFADNQRRRS